MSACLSDSYRDISRSYKKNNDSLSPVLKSDSQMSGGFNVLSNMMTLLLIVKQYLFLRPIMRSLANHYLAMQVGNGRLAAITVKTLSRGY